MANQLKMAAAHTIYTLLERGWSRRRIARELGIDRGTVRRYAQRAAAGIPPGEIDLPKPPGAPPGSDPVTTRTYDAGDGSKPAGAPPRSAGPDRAMDSNAVTAPPGFPTPVPRDRDPDEANPAPAPLGRRPASRPVPANCSVTGSWPSSTRGSAPSESGRTLSAITDSPPSTTACGGSCGSLGSALPGRSDARSASPGPRPRWTSAGAPRSCKPTAKGGIRMPSWQF